MAYNFDHVIDRRTSHSIKWRHYGPDILPLWVADMDFPAPPGVIAALERAVAHGIFGYEFPSRDLQEIIAARMSRLYGWRVAPDAILATPGVIAGFLVAAQAVCAAGEGVLIQPPVYPPFLTVHERAGLISQKAQLHYTSQGQIIKYIFDEAVFKSGLNADGSRTGMFLLCNPHNPTGQIFSGSELGFMADTCMKNGTVICSDEIHSEILLGEAVHTPIASLSNEVGANTITLIAPSKTFNVPGLFCAFAIIPNVSIRDRFRKIMERHAMHVNSLGLIAAQAAFSGDCDPWLMDLRQYLLENRNFLLEYVQNHFQGMKVTIPEATYLAWLDCRELQMKPNPFQFCLEKAKVALNDGAEFGPGGSGFLRLNFGCPRAILEDALERIRSVFAG